MSRVPYQNPDVVLLRKSKTGLDVGITGDVDGVLRVAPNPALPLILGWVDWVAAIIGKIGLHDAGRAGFMQGRHVPILPHVVAGSLVKGRKVIFLGFDIISRIEAGRSYWDGGDESAAHGGIECIPLLFGGPFRVGGNVSAGTGFSGAREQ